MNMVRCMINEKNVPKTFWPEVVNWVVHILNRCPTFVVKDITLEEASSGIKPSNVNEIEEHASDTQSEDLTNLEVPNSEDSNDENELGKRVLRRPGYLNNYETNDTNECETGESSDSQAFFSPSEDPITYNEAAKHGVWKQAMDTEIGAIESNDTWELTNLPPGAKKIGITIRTILAIAAARNWYVFQLDVKSAFLHGELDEEVYVEQPLVYQKQTKEMVYRLKKSLYGLKQAPRAWYNKIEAYFCKEGFVKCAHEHTLFLKKEAGDKIIINFAMTDLGRMRYFLGIEVKQTKEGIFMHQQKYACEILKRFNMENCNSVSNPTMPGNKLKKDETGIACDSTNYKQMVGCLMYLLATRPDLAFLGKDDKLTGWSDSDYAGDLDDRKSTYGYVFMIGSKVVSWSSKK
ncbi:copia-type polyprotein [Trifolium pratense]|uniref:Copia-type polyprotein n=1 Tax=Trifolium pratense TaxID=57577 RepID=A0A2K3NY17_TRIPR|nr:copia-type polyprotein [Trifolium pratense]